MSILLKFKMSPKGSTSNSKRSQSTSPLTHTTTMTTTHNISAQTTTDRADTDSCRSVDDMMTDSPTITVDIPTPGPKYCSNRPPPLHIPPRKTSLTVRTGPAAISASHSLDNICSKTTTKHYDNDIITRPSSPMLFALREAVDSVSNMADFKMIEKLGSGFFGEVFKVEHIDTKQIMVIKINRSESSQRTKREVEVLKKLSHPNLLHYLGACIHNGKIHPVTELVNGGTLESLIHDETHPFPVSLRVQLSHDLANGMQYLHSNGMLHRDFNSHNCLLRKDGHRYTAIVADFGLTANNPHKMINSLKRTQSVVGTPYWMAPEVLNSKPYGEEADVFSYGIVLCEIISRKEADPDEIPRLRDFSIDENKFRCLPEVKTSLCPPSFINIACSCTRHLPIERPDFISICDSLNIVSMVINGGKSRADSLPPTPEKRLSCHFPSTNKDNFLAEI